MGSVGIGPIVGGGGGGSEDHKVLVDSSDTTAAFLLAKLAAGPNVSLSVVNPGGNEQVQISASGGAITDEMVKVNALDTTAGYLAAKLVAGTNVTLTVQNLGGNETYRIDVTAADQYVKVNSYDTTPGYLASKLVVGAGLTLTVLNVGGNEQYRIDTQGKLKVSAYDNTPDYLSAKLTAWDSSIAFQIFGPGYEQYRVKWNGMYAYPGGSIRRLTLADMLTAGSNISFNYVADNVVINAIVPPAVDEKVKVDGSDPISGYLADKVVAGTGIGLTVNSPVVNPELLAHFDGSGGSYPPAITTGQLITYLGSTPGLDAVNFKFGTASMGFSRAMGGGMKVAGGPDTDLSGDFTIDMWIRREVSDFGQTTFFFDADAGPRVILGILTGNLQAHINQLGGWIDSGVAFPNDTNWHHVMLSRSGSNVYVALDGNVVLLTTGGAQLLTPGSDVWIGTGSNNVCYIDGQIDEFHWLNGTCLWTANFTPPAAPYPDPVPGETLSVAWEGMKAYGASPTPQPYLDNLISAGMGMQKQPVGGFGAVQLYSEGKLRASVTDPAMNLGYLADKLVAGANITLTLLNPGTNEQIEISSSAGPSTDELVKVSAYDTTPSYLGTKLVAGTNVTLTVLNAGGNETLQVNATAGSPTGTAKAIAYFNALGALASNAALLADQTDAFGRPCIWDFRTGGTGCMYRQGQWQSDGDPGNIEGDGAVFIGKSINGILSAGEGAYARIKKDRFGLFQIIPGFGSGFYMFRVDCDSSTTGGGIYVKDDTDTKTFSVARKQGYVYQRRGRVGTTNTDPGVNGRMVIEESVVLDNAGTPGITYFGSDTTDGSWRIRRVGNDLVFERRESGVWVQKGAITA